MIRDCKRIADKIMNLATPFCYETLADLLDDFSSRWLEVDERRLRTSAAVISEWADLLSKQRDANRAYSHLFNPLRRITIKEIDHSAILGDLLNKNGSHGQGTLFLSKFLHCLEVPGPDDGPWTVTVEKGRIDILLKREEPESVIIVENKANSAADQKHQLWRYWYQEIYPRKTNSRNEIGAYQVIYLPPNQFDRFSDQSLEPPKNLGEITMDVTPKILSFASFVVPWLEDAASGIDEGNHRLRTFLEFYIEIWR